MHPPPTSFQHVLVLFLLVFFWFSCFFWFWVWRLAGLTNSLFLSLSPWCMRIPPPWFFEHFVVWVVCGLLAFCVVFVLLLASFCLLCMFFVVSVGFVDKCGRSCRVKLFDYNVYWRYLGRWNHQTLTVPCFFCFFWVGETPKPLQFLVFFVFFGFWGTLGGKPPPLPTSPPPRIPQKHKQNKKNKEL